MVVVRDRPFFLVGKWTHSEKELELRGTNPAVVNLQFMMGSRGRGGKVGRKWTGAQLSASESECPRGPIDVDVVDCASSCSDPERQRAMTDSRRSVWPRDFVFTSAFC